jgi:HlyD family secretion protein
MEADVRKKPLLFVVVIVVCVLFALGMNRDALLRMYKDSTEEKLFVYAGSVDVTKITLSSRIASDIIFFKFQEGDVVKKDEVLVKLNDDVFQIASKQLNSEYDRSLKLLRSGSIAAEQHERVERAKKDNDLHIQWCQIKSPVDGTMITKFREEGEFVSPGTNIVSVANLKDVWVYFYVEHDKIHRLKIGDSVRCHLPEFPEKIFAGTIIKINAEAEFTPKNVQTRKERTRLVYGIKVKLQNDDQLLKPGMTLETTFQGS